MIKIVAFDLVGVLVTENDIELTEIEQKLERTFGNEYNDLDCISFARNYVSNDSDIIKITKDLIDKLYRAKDYDIFMNIKKKYPNIKIIIATNHLKYIRNYIEKYLDTKNIDDIIISSEINKSKPNIDFYEHLLNKYNINPKELLFIDDNNENIESAKVIGINTIKVDKNTNFYEIIDNYL